MYEQCLKSADQKEQRIPAIKHQVFNISLHMVIAQYSAGFSSEQMKDSFLDLIPRFEAGWCNTENNDNKIYFDGYIQALWMVSLAILLDVAVGDFQRIVNTLEGKNSQDMILDVLISTQLPRQKSEQLLYPQKFEFIKKLIDTQNIEGFKDYLDRK
ncbi:PoNe immunity protein domain-containing protein [Acinetobacter bereziniae]|uniref:PoNe immunity protein domain-containing protein n=1 Tax=Acinetobacter bereziniae TaxID=106648 RepID=UPI003465A754